VFRQSLLAETQDLFKSMINMTAIGLYMLLSTLSGNYAAMPTPIIETTEVMVLVEKKEESDNEIDKDVEAHVREYFKDIPILAEVAKCESHFTQFTKNGKVLRGRVVPQDVGVMQVNETYHLEASKKLGIDIYTLEGNMAYGRHLYEKRGTKDWMASSACWSKFNAIALKNHLQTQI